MFGRVCSTRANLKYQQGLREYNKFQGMFIFNTQIHNCNTRTNNLIRIPLVRTRLRQFSIQYQGPTIFNSLDNEIVNNVSYAAFTRKLKTYLIYSYCEDLQKP